MRLTTRQLRQIINEELTTVLTETTSPREANRMMAYTANRIANAFGMRRSLVTARDQFEERDLHDLVYYSIDGDLSRARSELISSLLRDRDDAAAMEKIEGSLLDLFNQFREPTEGSPEGMFSHIRGSRNEDLDVAIKNHFATQMAGEIRDQIASYRKK